MEQVISLFSKGKRIAFDTSICIYFFEGHQKYYHIVKQLFQAVENEQIIVYYSALLLTELYAGPLKKGDRSIVENWNKYFKHYPSFYMKSVDEKIAYKAAILRAKYMIKTPDALHIATAIEEKVSFFLTNDKNLKKITEIQVMCLEDLLE